MSKPDVDRVLLDMVQSQAHLLLIRRGCGVLLTPNVLDSAALLGCVR